MEEASGILTEVSLEFAQSVKAIKEYAIAPAFKILTGSSFTITFPYTC
jgi:hypothetical protein